MEEKEVIALMLIAMGVCGGSLLACASRRIRDVFFFLMVALAAVTEHIDVNMVSRDWYRGTSRGFEVSIVDILSISVLVSTVLFPRRGERRWFWPASFGLMLLYFFYAALCVGMADPKLFGLFALLKLVRGLIVFLAAAFFIRGERELRLFLVALGAAVCFEGLTALSERYYYGVHRVYGTVDDSNSLSMYLCTTAPVFVAVITSRLPNFLKALGGAAIALAGVGVILTISRAGLIAMGVMLLCATLATVSYKFSPKKILVTLLAIAATGGALAKSWKTLQSRFEGDSFKQEYENPHAMNRGYYIRIAVAIAQDRPFGVGPNNWSYWVSNEYGPKLGWHFVPYMGTDKEPSQIVPSGRNIDAAQAAPAHSLAALTAGEMGLGGLVLMVLLWLRWLQMGASFLWPRTPDPMRRVGVGILFGMGGTFIQSFTEWVFQHTPIFYTFHIMLGALASLYWLKKQERRQRRKAVESRESRVESREHATMAYYSSPRPSTFDPRPT